MNKLIKYFHNIINQIEVLKMEKYKKNLNFHLYKIYKQNK